jgi:hypothetical protein
VRFSRVLERAAFFAGVAIFYARVALAQPFYSGEVTPLPPVIQAATQEYPVAFNSPAYSTDSVLAPPDSYGPAVGYGDAASGYGGGGYGAELPPVCEDCPRFSYYAFVGYDAWKGTADGAWGHYGLHTGLNLGTKLGALSDWTGIGFQAGGSVGIYDWSGSDYRAVNETESLTQGFLTYGLFRRASEQSRWCGAVVHDWMVSHNFSVFAENPTLGQIRGQVGYALNGNHEIGLWGAVRERTETIDVDGFGPVSWRAVNQVSFYWHYRFQFGADTTISVGIPETERLAGDGSLGDYIAYAAANMPLNHYSSMYTLISYMHPSASAGVSGAREDAWALLIGVSLYPRRNALAGNIAGQCWAPMMPVANNGNFFVDASANY